MNTAIVALRAALNNLHRDDLAELTVEQLERLEIDMSAWTGIMIGVEMEKRVAAQSEARE